MASSAFCACQSQAPLFFYFLSSFASLFPTTGHTLVMLGSSPRALALALAATAVLLAWGAGAQPLPGPNPFIANGSPPPPGPPATGTPPPPPPPATPPAATAAPAPGPEADGSGPCACTPDGLSGGTNTSAVGCGQLDIAAGSNRFTCFVVVRGAAGAPAPNPSGLTQHASPAPNPAPNPRCSPQQPHHPCPGPSGISPQTPADCKGWQLTPDPKLPAAARRACTASEAGAALPPVARLLAGTPQLVQFFSTLKSANLSSVFGDQVTSRLGAQWSGVLEGCWGITVPCAQPAWTPEAQRTS